MVTFILWSNIKYFLNLLFLHSPSNISFLTELKDASDVIEKAYSEATPLQQCRFVEELYGKEFALFKVCFLNLIIFS